MSMDFSSDSVIKYIIGSSRIKYDKLNKLFENIWITDHTVVLHVDAFAILYRLYREKFLESLYSVQEDVLIKDIVVEFLNVIGHYRRYIATRLNKTNDIIIYYNNKVPKYQYELFKDYNKSYYKLIDPQHKDYGVISKIIRQAMSYIEGIVPYFEGIYLIDNSNIDTYTTIAYIMELPQYKNDTFHIIFSQNQLTLQLLNNHVIQLINHKDKSQIITNKNYINDFLLKNNKKKPNIEIAPKILPLLWTLCGCPDIDMKATNYIKGIGRTFLWLSDDIKNQFIVPDMSIQSFLNIISRKVTDGAIELRHPTNTILNRYRVLSLSLCISALSDDQKIKIQKNMIDLYDQTMLEQINEMLSNISSFGSLIEITNLNMSTSNDDLDKITFFYNHPEMFL